jgi:cytoskeletal protein CcmA (bactofilin family)
MFGKKKGPRSPGEPSAPQLSEGSGAAVASGAGLPDSAENLARQAALPGGKSAAVSAGATAPKSPPRRAEGRPASSVEGRKLVVGREICLSGEIKTCEKLVVEGKVEADLRDSHSLEISEPGLFKGNALVVDCEISGTFEGDLTVTGLLVVQPTGRVSGKIRYADMELSRGARLSGDVDVLDEAALKRARGEGPKLAHDNSTQDSSGGGGATGVPGKSQIG